MGDNSSVDILSSYAFADARHDFGASTAANYYTQLQDSLPGTIHWISSDNSVVADAIARTGNELKMLTLNTPNETFLQLGGSAEKPIAILCDSGFCTSLIEHLSGNTIGHVYILRNRELENDPGSNISISRIRPPIYIAEEIRDREIVYTSWDSSETINSKLCSIYTVILDSEEMVIASYSEVVDTILYSDQMQTISDIRRTIGEYDFTNTYRYYNSNESTMIQTAFLRKRSGDWLQVLSCTDRDRTYTINGISKNLKDVVTYFCSEDRIPIGYALYLGINCIRKSSNNTYTYFLNPDDDISHSYADSRYMASIAKFTELATSSYAESSEILSYGIRFYESRTAEFKAILLNIEDVRSVHELRIHLHTALRYAYFIKYYKYVIHHKELIEKFLTRTDTTTFDNVEKDTIQQAIFFTRLANSQYHDMNIDDPIYDETLMQFNPTTYYVERSQIKYSVIYCQAILHSLMRIADDVLKRFVISFIDKLLHITDDDIIRTHYSLFLERYTEYYSSGGGIRKAYRADALQFIGTYLLEYILQKKYTVFVYIKHNSRVSLGELPMCTSMLQTIVDKFGIHIKGYAEYAKSHSEQFLKMIKRARRTVKNRRSHGRKHTFRQNRKI